ncbi:hypothetical protein L227DRAFT_613011 [Lentinus tigrinus ALCF2SS1-6]|uniref:DUF6533 domain-containing protein n=1 Tax=Lentinus tigrinus ALCF2SS1-6 TaxID=1328759 RepID=A0A5C2S3Q5_9APHY|nr:hypothetical protein L227DRAFT_613011 [Lentinus tigrinus ALCF2SS1-6]
MSSAAFVQGFLINNYCECAAATLLFFEYFVHLAQEIDLFWKERLTGASVLFLSNRYLSLLNQILLVFPSPTSEKLFILRFHLSDDWPAALLSMGSIFRLTRIGAVSAPWQMAHRDARPPIVFRAYRDQLRRLSLGELRCNTDNWMLRILALLNVLHLLFTMLSIAVEALADVSLVTIFTEPITSILVSRFLLDLQKVNRYRANPQLSSVSIGQGSLHFANSRVIGSLGESLPPPGDTSLEDARLAAEDVSEDLEHGGDKVGQDPPETNAIVVELKLRSTPLSCNSSPPSPRLPLRHRWHRTQPRATILSALSSPPPDILHGVHTPPEVPPSMNLPHHLLALLRRRISACPACLRLALTPSPGVLANAHVLPISDEDDWTR